MKRRKAINTIVHGSGYALLFSHLLACKSDNKSELNNLQKAADRLNIKLPSGVSYKMDYLNGNVGYFIDKGGTIGWMATKDHIVVVDTQFPEQSEHLIDQLSYMSDKLGRDNAIDLLVNTHHHGDHTAGNIAYKDLTSKIVAHDNSKINQMNSAAKKGNESTQLYPTETFAESWTSKVGNEIIAMDYYGAAHTNGDAITHFQNANVVHMGDLVFNRRFPYIDTGAGANISNWINILDQVLNKFDDSTKFIFGHSDNGYDVVGNKEDIKAFQNYLSSLLEFGNEAIKSGKSLEKLLESTKAIPGALEWKGKGIERSINAVYAELS